MIFNKDKDGVKQYSWPVTILTTKHAKPKRKGKTKNFFVVFANVSFAFMTAKKSEPLPKNS
jgi:hypothetical protein